MSEGLHNHTENAEKFEGALDKDAEIYNHKETKTGWQQLKELRGREKRAYFMEYFSRTVVVILIIAAVVGYFIYSRVTSKNYLINIMVIDSVGTGTEDAVQDYFDNFLVEHGLNPKKETVSVNSSIYPLSEDSDSVLGALEVIFTRFAAKQVDLCFSDHVYFDQMSTQGYFMDLRDYLTTEEFQGLGEEGRIIYTQLTEEDENGEVYVPDGAESVPAGVLLDADEGWLKEAGWYTKEQEPVIGISAVVQEEDLTLELFREIVFSK